MRSAIVVAVVMQLVGPIFADDTVRNIAGCGCCLGGFGLSVALFWYFFREFLTEWGRGQRQEMSLDEALEDLPQKKQVKFKGEKVPDWKISPRQKATKALLKFLSYTDNWFEYQYLSGVADEAYRLVKQAIEDLTVRGIERRLTPECLEEISAEIKKLRKEREHRVFGRVEVTGVVILQVEAPTGKENHTFTALISARLRDFYEDDETGDLLRGDKNLYAVQEIWSFRRTEKRWLVELMQTTGELDSTLEAKNVLPQIDYEEFAKDAEEEHLEHVTAR